MFPGSITFPSATWIVKSSKQDFDCSFKPKITFRKHAIVPYFVQSNFQMKPNVAQGQQQINRGIRMQFSDIVGKRKRVTETGPCNGTLHKKFRCDEICVALPVKDVSQKDCRLVRKRYCSSAPTVRNSRVLNCPPTPSPRRNCYCNVRMMGSLPTTILKTNAFACWSGQLAKFRLCSM